MEAKNNYHSHPNKLVKKGALSVMLFITLLAFLIPFKLHAAPPESFLLFYSNNIQGETEPCG